MRVFLEGGEATLAAAAAVVADPASLRIPLSDVVLKASDCPVTPALCTAMFRVTVFATWSAVVVAPLAVACA